MGLALKFVLGDAVSDCAPTWACAGAIGFAPHSIVVAIESAAIGRIIFKLLMISSSRARFEQASRDIRVLYPRKACSCCHFRADRRIAKARQDPAEDLTPAGT